MPKQDKPFVLATELTHLDRLGSPERIERRSGGRVEQKVRLRVQSEYQLVGHGVGTVPWFEHLRANEWRQDVSSLLDSLAINPEPTTGVNDQTVTLAGSQERRVQQDWRFTYSIASGWYDASAEFSAFQFDGTFRDNPEQTTPDALDFTMVATD
jgi:hypothetical protein